MAKHNFVIVKPVSSDVLHIARINDDDVYLSAGEYVSCYVTADENILARCVCDSMKAEESLMREIFHADPGRTLCVFGRYVLRPFFMHAEGETHGEE